MHVILQEHAVDRTRENKLRNQLLKIQQENCLNLFKKIATPRNAAGIPNKIKGV